MITLVLGGARSGKSEFAERLAAGLPEPVSYVATMKVGQDPDLVARVERHRARRPPGWATHEVVEDLPGFLRRQDGSVLLDALGGWVALSRASGRDVEALCSALVERHGDTVVVSEEVGMGVHPSSEAGRWFRDALGTLNQAVAAAADEVVLVVAGCALRLEHPR